MPAELVVSAPEDLPGDAAARRLAHHRDHQRPGRGLRRRPGGAARRAGGAAARRQRDRLPGDGPGRRRRPRRAARPRRAGAARPARRRRHRRRWSSWPAPSSASSTCTRSAAPATARSPCRSWSTACGEAAAPRPGRRRAQGAARVRRRPRPQGVHARPAGRRRARDPAGLPRRAGCAGTRRSGSSRRTARCRRCSTGPRWAPTALVDLLRGIVLSRRSHRAR